MTIALPSKTFLLGEYAVLAHAPAHLLITPPTFNLTLGAGDHAFHPDSAAGRLMAAAASAQSMTFTPHGLKGLGQSGAEFIAAYLATESGATWPMPPIDIANVWQRYQRLHDGHTSGADVMAQALGQSCWVQCDPWCIEAAPWPFEGIAWGLWHTGQNLSTHTHMKTGHHVPEQLVRLAHQGHQAFEQKDEGAWLSVLKRYHDALVAYDLCAPYTQTLVAQLQANDDVLAAKGCGAMGAEVIWVGYKPGRSTAIHALTASMALNPIV